MRLIPLVFIIWVSCIPSEGIAQLLLRVETGVSNFAVHSSSHNNLKKDWGRQEYLQAYRVGIEKIFQFNKLGISSGGSLSLIGANHIFTGRWRYMYAGLSIGTQYQLGKVYLGLRTTPSIELWTNWPAGFEPKRSYNIDLEPNFALDIRKRLKLTAGTSFGINPSVVFSDNAIYKHVAYLLGLTYVINKNKN